MRTQRTMGLVTDYFPEGEEFIQITLIKEPVEEARYKQLRREAEKDVELESRGCAPTSKSLLQWRFHPTVPRSALLLEVSHDG